MNKLDRDSCIDDFITCLPHEKPRDIAFIPSVHAWKDGGYSVNDAYHVTQHQQRKQTTSFIYRSSLKRRILKMHDRLRKKIRQWAR